MPTYTTNFGFAKPDNGQPNWASAMNANLDALDTALGLAAGGATEIVTYSATPVFNSNNGLVKLITLTGNVTSSSVTNDRAGLLTFVIKQDATGGRSFVFPSNFRNPGVISTANRTAAANSYSTQSFVYVPSAGIYIAATPFIYGE